MVVTNVTAQQLDKAAATVGKKYADNVRIEHSAASNTGKRHRLRIFVKSSKGPGARRSYSGRRLVNACWHVHGEYFDALLAIEPDAIIRPSNTSKIDRNGGNWQDINIGNYFMPMYMSEACEC